MSDSVFVGQNVSDLDIGEKPARISRVNILVDSEHQYTAGDDTGRTLEKTVPWGTQAMADAILAAVKDYDYQPFTGTDALLDPAAEIGDGITVGGVYSVLVQKDIAFGKLTTTDIAAPGTDEIDDEYPYISRAQRQEQRQLAITRSMISKTSEQIRLAIEGFDGRLSEFSVNIDSIVSDVEGLDGAFSKLEQTVNGFTYTGPDGKVMISNGSINLTGSITWGDLTSDVQDRVGDGLTEDIVHTLIKDDLVESPTIRGTNIYGGMYWDSEGVASLNLSNDLFGYRQVPSLQFRRADGTDIFGAYDGDFGTSITGLGGNLSMVIDTSTTSAYGVWDFKNATVTGLIPNFAQVPQLTSTHTEFYLYVTFSGVGLYTPVYAAVMSRTYTFVASSPSQSSDYPIYGMTIRVNSGGTVDVSNIYAIYPGNVHQNAIAFNVGNITIYAR